MGIRKDDCEKNIALLKSAIFQMEIAKDKIILSSWDGELAAISIDGNTLWKIKVSQEAINGIFECNDKLNILDNRGNFFQLNSTTGEIINKDKWDFRSVSGSIASNLIVFRDWFIATGGGGIWAHWSKDHHKSFHYYIDDLLVRKLISHSQGFFTGDDGGYIRFWKIGGLRVQ